MNNTLSFYLLLTTMILGFRHGLDWDHIAAIGDITGTELALTTEHGKIFRMFRLPALYSIGHLLSVGTLALITRFVASQMPEWLDPLMEKLVGSSLVLFGIWLTVSIVQDLRHKRQVTVRSRWSMLSQFTHKLFGSDHSHGEVARNDGACPSPAAFGLGMLHGIGAETGTQILLLTTICPASPGAAVALLLAFAFGLLASSCVLSAAMLAGSATAAKVNGIAAILGVSAAVFSTVFGTLMLTGQSERFPTLFSLAPSGLGM